jgi:DNA-directed RNA polymerase subunit H (RpoH/RPB5)
MIDLIRQAQYEEVAKALTGGETKEEILKRLKLNKSQLRYIQKQPAVRQLMEEYLGKAKVKVEDNTEILDKEHRLKLLTDIIRNAERKGDIDTLLKAIQTLDKIDDRRAASEPNAKQVIISLPDNERNVEEVIEEESEDE